ncbi:MBL fold metallo-hydrolase [Actinocorallia sp. B10E7]|uniref:MBL fold metallo-hydrolase n=1 Tax=Actinocorallia sp. B10E7 TaxID=3153558 RepID=UPI00325F10E3
MFGFLRRRRGELATIDAEFTALTEAFTRSLSASDQDFHSMSLMGEYALARDAYEKAKEAFAEDRESEAALRALAECRHAFARFNAWLESPERVRVRVLGGPTVLIEIDGLKILVDPAFGDPGGHPVGDGEFRTETALGRIGMVLLSHYQHPDDLDLDISVRAFLDEVPLFLTTTAGAHHLGGSALGMTPWRSLDLTRPHGAPFTVTAVPARHGADGCESPAGEVTGFILTAPDLPALYVSGGDASLDVVRQIASRFGPVDIAVLALDGPRAAEAATLLNARQVIPVHRDGRSRRTESPAGSTQAFGTADPAPLLSGTDAFPGSRTAVSGSGRSFADANREDGFGVPADMVDDLARGRALALHIMSGLEQELLQEEAATGRPLEAARSLLEGWRAGDPGDLYMATDEIQLFTAELALARAARLGDAYRPCPFDPYHAGAEVRVLWRPQGAAPRSVLCCPDDAALIQNGGQPAARLVSDLSGKVPLWDADDVYTRWLLGHFAAVGTAQIGEVYQDTGLGRMLHLLRIR